MDQIRYILANHLDGVVFGTLLFLNFIFSGIATSLVAPTAQDTKNYIFWFRFVNYCAWNLARAKGAPRVEDSPNFIPAAEAYMAKKLAGPNQTGSTSHG